MIMNWFSPLPPAKTGIAFYTARMLPTLCRRAEVILWTDQAEWDPSLENYAEVRRYQAEQMPWAELNRGHISLYNIGNNRLFHGSIWQVSRRHPGIIILHDRCLQNFFAGLYREQWNDRDGYVTQMERYYGPMGRQDAEMFWDGSLPIESMVESYPLTPLAVDNALGVLVHSEEGLDDLKSNAVCPVIYAPLPYPASPRLATSHAGAARVSIRGLPYRIITLGYIAANRRLDALLQALAALPERDRFRLDIYGQLWDDDYVRSRIRSLGLTELVILHGFVSEAELDKALATAHLGVNLRYPTMGEASLSQLQMWDHALPTLVTRVGWYAKFPDTAVAFIRPDHEVRDIQTQLKAFLDDPDRFAAMGECGRRILEEQHTLEAYAEALIDLVAEAQRFRPRAAAYDVARRVSAEISVWADQPAPQLVSYLWEQGEVLRPGKDALVKRTDGASPSQAALLQAIGEAMAEQVKRLHDEQAMTLEAIQQAVVAQTARLDHLQTEIFQGALKEPYDREHALRFPLSVGNHDVGFRYLFDFMVVANSLNLRPGAEVLDFAAGSCYVSELLNRLGYITVAFDMDPEVLAIGRDRLGLDPRCEVGRTSFVGGDGTRLPFHDETFDGIICMNALHHMPDYRATLAEMCRVLRPGGRAVFSEPGSEHSKQPESINMMKQFGVLERDIILSEIYQLAKAVGFQRMVLKPYVSPEHVELDYDQFCLFKEGKRVSAPYLTAQEIAQFIERFHPLFYLEKRGERPLTSATARPELLQARIVLNQCPTQVKKGEVIKVVALCQNTGQSLWLSKPRPFGGYITFGVKFLTPAGRLLDDSRGRQPLSQDVAPGGEVEVVTELALEGLEAGRYRLLFDMVNEQIHWFQDKGSEIAERWIEIV
jgi:ubiquinone/menaquinone biosynthesis C-methylase UbiE/glycosyltransferase involved in cell wall biosynthesis